MEIIRKTDILVETKRRFIISQPESNEQFFCPLCAGQMITAEASAVLFGLSRRVIYRIVEKETAHFCETDSGLIMICPESFAEILANNTANAI